MSNNKELQNAALSGAVGGFNDGRALNSAVSTSYATVVNAALAFAQKVDASIATATAVTSTEICLLAHICRSVTSGRFDDSATSSHYATLGAAAAALYVESHAALTA